MVKESVGAGQDRQERAGLAVQLAEEGVRAGPDHTRLDRAVSLPAGASPPVPVTRPCRRCAAVAPKGGAGDVANWSRHARDVAIEPRPVRVA